MSERKDLTRWNRAGLNRFRYVDGKAAEYLEILRQQLVDKFKDPKTQRCEWLSPADEIPENEKTPEDKTETLIQRQERLSRIQNRILESYDQDRRDWAWEITRTFVRACHILTEHTNAYANEGYLGTATQWDNVRRLVEMLDYHPAPPASAYTRLVLIAKENRQEKENETVEEKKKDNEKKKGIVAKGFQVKHSPPNGGDKVIFETLEDLIIDPALNALRPKGWDQLGDTAMPPNDNGDNGPPADDQLFSKIANGPAINIQGVEQLSADKLDELTNGEGFLIKDFLDLEPNNTELDITPTWLWKWKAKADFLVNFAPEGDWSVIEHKLLPEIAETSVEALTEESGNSLDIANSLKLAIGIVEICLDQDVYEDTTLADLLVYVADDMPGEPDYVASPWRAKRKPKAEPGQVAMIYRETENIAEAATIDRVDEPHKDIRLLLDQVQYSWPTWPRSEVSLFVAPRWERECWLNGSNVIRTRELHGLTAGAYIGWNADWNTSQQWNFAAMEYAAILEADKRNLRLRYGYGLRLMSENQTVDLEQEGRSLVIVAMVGGLQLHIRIFDAGGERVVDIAESEILPSKALATLRQRLSPWPDESGLSQEDKQKIIENAASCCGYDLLPQEGTTLIELRPIDESTLSADYEEIALLNVKGEPDQRGGVLEDVSPDIESPFESIFTIQTPPADSGVSGGGGLLPPASLPKIGSFLFPSPMLPMDLVKAAVELMLSLGVMQIPSNKKFVIKGLPLTIGDPPQQIDTASALYTFLDGLWIRDLVDAAGTEIDDVKVIDWNEVFSPDENPDRVQAKKDRLAAILSKAEEPSPLFKEISEGIERSGPLLATPTEPSKTADVDLTVPRYVFEGSSNKIETGDWVVAEFSDGLRALQVSEIKNYTDEDKTERFSLSFENLVGNVGELKEVYSDFRGELSPEEGTENETPVDPDNIELEDVPDSLKVGQGVLLTAEGKEPVTAKIQSIDGNTIKTDPPAIDYAKGNLIIRGNVVLAGHGEGKPERILGSGDATKSNQEFTLEVEKVSFTPDGTKSSGVAAAIDVKVAGRIWEQVSTLKDSTPGDHHYAVRMTEEGYVRILFGDGEHGRRLPSGKNNIRVRYRVGSGLAGNVPAKGLEKPVNPHPLIETVLQPRRAAGGGDMEDVTSLRENAPPTLLALERAVSLSDFSHLAASQSSVWQARAYRQILHGGRTESVKVVIVPADGVESQATNGDMQSFLQKRALPGVQVTVDDFVRNLFNLLVTVRVKIDEFVPEQVEKAVASGLVDHFKLKNRKLGEHLYLSEVYKVVEGIQGVENSTCVLNGVKSLQVIKAENESTVVYLDTGADRKPSTLTVTHEEYEP